MTDHSRAVQAIQALINRYWIRGLIFPRSSEIEQVLRETLPKESEIVCDLRHQLSVCCEAVKAGLALRERLVELIKEYRDRGETIMELGDVADLLTSGRGVDGARAGHGTGGRGESDSTIGLPPTSPTNFEPAPPKGDVAAPPEPEQSWHDLAEPLRAERVCELIFRYISNDSVKEAACLLWDYHNVLTYGTGEAEAPAEPVTQPQEPIEAHQPIECRSRYCAQHRDIWRHYEDVIAKAVQGEQANPSASPQANPVSSPWPSGRRPDYLDRPSTESPAPKKEPR